MPTTLPPAVAAIIPAVISVLSHYLRDDGLPSVVNFVVSLIAILVLGALCAMSIGFTTSLWADILLTIEYVILILKEFMDMWEYALGIQSPLVIEKKSVATTSALPSTEKK